MEWELPRRWSRRAMRSRGAISIVDLGGAFRSVGLRRIGCSCGGHRGSRGRRWLGAEEGKGGGGGQESREMRKHSPGGRGRLAPFLLVVGAIWSNRRGFFITKRRHWIPEHGPMGKEHVDGYYWEVLGYQCGTCVTGSPRVL